MKKIITFILVLFIIFGATCINVNAGDGDGMSEKDLIEELDDNIDKLVNTTEKVKEVAKTAQAVAEVQSTFKSFMENVRYASIALSLINGSVTFLKLIGVIKDETKENVNNIMYQLENIDERLIEMDEKLNNLTTEMAKVESSVEYSSRLEKALLLESSWNDFSYRYLETGLDKLIDDYNVMLVDGMREWFNNQNRNAQNIDNNTITVVYNDNNLVYLLDNTVSSSYKYVTLKGDLIPSTLNWNVDTYQSDLYDYLYNQVSSAITNNELTKFDTNIDLTEYNDTKIKDLVDDAVNTLIYRVVASKINKDGTYAKELLRTYQNYCNHLGSKDDGLDSVIKTYYFTHSFEYEISEDINDFCNRMALKNGVYGMFVANVLGASVTTTSAEKKLALEVFNNSMNIINTILKNSLTGWHDYSYITNTRIRLVDLDYEGSGKVKIKVANVGEKSYEASTINKISTVIHAGSTDNYYMLDDAKLLLLESVMNSNGNSLTYQYFKDNDLAPLTYNFDKIITYSTDNQKFTLDGTKVHVLNYAGDYFNSLAITKLPEDATGSYLSSGYKVLANYYDFDSHKLVTGKTVAAIGLYAEDHWYWKTAEVAMLVGPYSESNFFGGGENKLDKYNREYTVTFTFHFNTIICMPLEESLKGDGYSPIDDYKEFIESIEVTNNDQPTKDISKYMLIVYLVFAVIIAGATIAVFTINKKERK